MEFSFLHNPESVDSWSLTAAKAMDETWTECFYFAPRVMGWRIRLI